MEIILKQKRGNEVRTFVVDTNNYSNSVSYITRKQGYAIEGPFPQNISALELEAIIETVQRAIIEKKTVVEITDEIFALKEKAC